MPDVKVGSVIDLQFKILGVPNQWRFQETIPVVWSEMRIEPFSGFRFRKYFYGTEPIDINSDYRWVAKDMPAFKDEPYMNSRDNYMSRYDFDMYSLILSYLVPSWNALSFRLEQDFQFGRAFKGSINLSKIASEIEQNTNSDEEKLSAAFDSIKRIKWDNNQRLFSSSRSLSYIQNKGTGNSADINLALFQLLKNLGIEAYPVALSTRDNGMISPAYVAFRKLNHVIVFAENIKRRLLS